MRLSILKTLTTAALLVGAPQSFSAEPAAHANAPKKRHFVPLQGGPRPVEVAPAPKESRSGDFESIRQKLRQAVGQNFLGRLKKDYQPTAADRRQLIAAAETVLSPSERATFAMIATAWAEERASVSDPRCKTLNARSPATLIESCREDNVGRANMLFTMKIIDNRADPRTRNRQFTERDFWQKDKLERVWGVVTKDRAFSSWNAGSHNFGNMLSMLLGEADHLRLPEHVALERAVRAHRDFSSGRVIFQGFEHEGHLATHMLNGNEVKAIRAKSANIVSWTIEDSMRKHRSGLHEVGVRVPAFSVTLPEGKVGSRDIRHWPVYLNNVDRKNMEQVRLSQGAW